MESTNEGAVIVLPLTFSVPWTTRNDAPEVVRLSWRVYVPFGQLNCGMPVNVLPAQVIVCCPVPHIEKLLERESVIPALSVMLPLMRSDEPDEIVPVNPVHVQLRKWHTSMGYEPDPEFASKITSS
jgi:hypothetical protein